MKKAILLAGAVAMLGVQSCRSDDDFIVTPALSGVPLISDLPNMNRPADSAAVPTDTSAVKDPIPPRKDPIQWMTPEELRQKLIEALRRLAQ